MIVRIIVVRPDKIRLEKVKIKPEVITVIERLVDQNIVTMTKTRVTTCYRSMESAVLLEIYMNQ